MNDMEVKLPKKEIIEIITDILEIHTCLKKQKNGSYEGEIEADYRDELSNEQIIKICESNEPMETFYEMFEIIEAEDDSWSWVFNTVKEKWDNDIIEYSEVENIIVDYLNENLSFNFDYDHYLHQDICIDIIVDTGGGNYDYTLNNWLTWDAREEEIDDDSSVLWLVQQQGYTKKQLKSLIDEGNDFNSKFLKSIRIELINVSTHMSCLVFLQKWTLKEFIDYKENPIDINIPLRTTCGLYDAWNGAGSVLEIQLEKSIIIPKDFAQPDVDGIRGYGIKEIYGINSCLWE